MMTEAVEFTNKIGQVIKPGDEVIIVTTGWGNTYTAKGVYLGMNGKGAQARVEENTSKWVFNDSGEDVNGEFWNLLNGIRWNDPDYATKRKALMDQIHTVPIVYYRKTTLKKNRIFKLAA